MTDPNNTQNEHISKIYTEEEIFKLFQLFRNKEQATTQTVKENRESPVEIASSLDNTMR